MLGIEDPCFAFVKATCRDAFEVADLVRDAGWQDLDQALAALIPLNKLAGRFAPIEVPQIEPNLARESLPTASKSDVELAIRMAVTAPDDVIRFATNVSFKLYDESYGLLAPDQVSDVAAMSPTDAWVFRPVTSDCDDFARGFIGWLASFTLGNAAIGTISFTGYKGDELLGAHMGNIAVDSSMQVRYIEPQTNKVHSLQALPVFKSATKILVTEVRL